MDKWQELTIEVNREVEEAASNILIESGSQGVAIDDSADYLENADRFGELYPEVEQVETVKITAYYPESADIEAITKQVNERLAELTDFGFETGDIHLATQHKGFQAVLGAGMGITHMAGNALDVGVTLHKALENLVLLFIAGL